MISKNPKTIWLGLTIISFALISFRHYNGFSIEHNILELLPKTTDSQLINTVKRVSEDNARKLVFLLGHQNKTTAISAAHFLKSELKKKPYIETVLSGIDSDDKRRFFDFYIRYAGLIISPEDRSALEQKQIEHIKSTIEQNIYSPTNTNIGQLLKRDPLLLGLNNLKNLQKLNKQLSIEQDVALVYDQEQTYSVIEATLNLSPFSRQNQLLISPEIKLLKDQLKEKFSGLNILEASTLKFASYAGQTSEQDIMRISIGSALGVSILLFVCFRSFKVIFISVLPILTGILFGIAVLSLFFSKLHIITLAFGASLIGIAIDYCIHYLLRNSQETIRSIRLSLFTSCIGYSALLIAPFEGIKQMACFSIVGLIGSYIGIRLLFSDQLLASLEQPQLSSFLTKIFEFLKINLKPLYICLFVMITLGILTQYIPKSVNDDIRLFQPAPEELLTEQEKVQNLLGNFSSNAFIIVQGATPQIVLKKLEDIEEQLEAGVTQEFYSNYLSLSSFISSISKQESNKQLVLKTIEPNSQIQLHLSQLGFQPELLESFRNQLSQLPPIKLQEWIKSKVGQKFKYLWLDKLENKYSSLVLFSGLTNFEYLKELTKTKDDVFFINQTQEISSLFASYRKHISYLLILASCLIFIILIFNFGIATAFKMLLVPAASGSLAITSLLLLGLPINIFALLGLILVAAIGIDFSIFMTTHKQAQTKVYLGNLLSACTSITAFGLLALSSMPALQTFGTVLFIGILTAVILCPCIAQYD